MNKFALHQAAKMGNMDNVRKLIHEGVSVDSRDHMGRTPLHVASEKGWYEVAQLLINNKCDLNLKDREGQTAVMLAAMSRKKDVVGLLLQRGAQVSYEDEGACTLLRLAIAYGWSDLFPRILDRVEADFNSAHSDYDGVTPLMWATLLGYTELASLLVRAGTDVNRRAEGMSTALHVAAFYGRMEVMQMLLGVEGLQLNTLDRHGETPLHYACIGIEEKALVVKLLLEAGADTTLKNNLNKTALSNVIGIQTINMKELIGLFVDHGHFLEDSEYAGIYDNPVLRESVLRDVDLCTQSIVNKFNGQSLPALYNIPHVSRSLPPIKFMKLSDAQTHQVANFVASEIKAKSYCNVVAARPLVLQLLCVLALIPRQA